MTTTTKRAPRAEGQWAVDGTAPLNPNEVFKAADDGLHVRKRIEEIYAKQGFDSIPSDDLHGRMRWWGLYTQRRQGIDGSRTAELTPDQLSDRYFMMRVRLDGGALSTELTAASAIFADPQIGKLVRDSGLKGVRTQVQGDELRVFSKKRDELQAVQKMVREADYDFAVQFDNYR